ncbi:aminotransferase class I/II-fold pyridoxal phosphate-dependent enzyme [Clostridium sp. CS001]|uniref:threonine aldolase family protein n=1 Tax=Clostridium sp. CS001 TaxID=2880648 RepID=UPI001CF3EF91|nr:aminotransferase class I/II-fold pyridoxal phosphate-dependent enzyme [Clostridium sp. CS001]MCB2291149.1 aminotransferase class I/II-fold pyridoxal phosphate-dependent enzyme [Clostridium sp. CS001]
MYSFKNDYSEGAHPNILRALIETNMQQLEGYGEDKYSLDAISLLKSKLKCEDVDIHMLCGGTQTNLTVISAFLRPHEAIISANTGHILVHETGAIEATGHKIISVKVEDGKLKPIHIKEVINEHADEHMVKPKMVFISNPTEIGSIYKKCELEELSGFCRENNLILYIDGARLGSALCSKENDIELSDLPKLVDAFYIGGTKNGALMGEALVICKDSLKEDFRYHIKQKGGLLAKGRLIGIQFLELFKEDIYFDLAKHANRMAELLKIGISDLGYEFLTNSPSNQIFPILPISVIDKLQEKYSFYVWQKIDGDISAIRLVTSWATGEEVVKRFIEDLTIYSSK